MIFVTGDCHGTYNKFSTKNFPEQKELALTKDDYVIVCGDFGLIWDQEQSKHELYDINWFDEKPWTTLFVDGNHENHYRLNHDFPVEEWHGGKIHRISDSVIHLMRGEMYELDGKKCFAFGGAASHDYDEILHPDTDPSWKLKKKKLKKRNIWFRTEGLDWWENEVPSAQEQNHGIDTLYDNDWKCDFVFTHACPDTWLPALADLDGGSDPTGAYLDKIKRKLDFQHWFCGHMHQEKNLSESEHCIYHQIVQLT